MKLNLMLADSAQIDSQSKIHALGINWTHTRSPTPPMSLIAITELSHDQIPTELAIHVELQDSKGIPAKVMLGPAGLQALQLDAPAKVSEFESHRRGEPVLVPTVIELGPGILLAPGDYAFVMTVTDESTQTSIVAERKFRIRRPEEEDS